MNNLFFMSDPHYGQKNIVKALTTWPKEEARDFQTVEQMNSTIVDGINKKVGQDDTLWCLGDWSFGGIENIWNFRKRIICKNVHLIYGNHDEHIENNKHLPNVQWTYDRSSFIDEPNRKLSKDLNPVRAKDMFSSLQHVKMLKIGKKDGAVRIFMSHYAHRVWPKSHQGYWHLYGHSHSNLEHEQWGKSMDVGIDNYFRLFGKYEPFSYEEIAKIMNSRELKFVDHHNQNTNQ